MMQTTYRTADAARRIGVSFRTLNRWIAHGTICPSKGVPYGGDRTLWLWTDADIAKGRKVRSAQKSGPKADAK